MAVIRMTSGKSAIGPHFSTESSIRYGLCGLELRFIAISPVPLTVAHIGQQVEQQENIFGNSNYTLLSHTKYEISAF